MGRLAVIVGCDICDPTPLAAPAGWQEKLGDADKASLDHA